MCTFVISHRPVMTRMVKKRPIWSMEMRTSPPFSYSCSHFCRYPNPNNLVEVGYAMAFIPLPCCIYIQSSERQLPTEKFPFNLRHLRFTKYDMSDKDRKSDLKNFIIEALKHRFSAVIPEFLKILRDSYYYHENELQQVEDAMKKKIPVTIRNFPKRYSNLQFFNFLISFSCRCLRELNEYQQKFARYVQITAQDRNNIVNEAVVNDVVLKFLPKQ